jgi:hypothetical protein
MLVLDEWKRASAGELSKNAASLSTARWPVILATRSLRKR